MNIHGPVFTYSEFYDWMLSLVADGKTSGNNQTEVLADFTALNKRRMSRLNRTLVLQPDLIFKLESIEKPQNWLVITEAWCGDSAQSLPVIGKMASYSDKIKLSIVLRDENPQLMEVYHTNGSKSIPKLISFDENEKELFLWGPRPKPAQEILTNWKREPEGKNWEEFEKELHTWYARDKTVTLQQEFIQIFNEL